MSRARVDKLLATCVVACVLLAATCYSTAELHWFHGAVAGMAGAYAREIDPQGAPWAEAEAQRTGLAALHDSRRLVREGHAFVLLAIIGTIVAALRTYRDWRSWHWLAFVASGPLLAASWFAVGRLLYGTGSSHIWIPVGCVVALACGIDLRRPRSTGPGRIVAWFVLTISVSVVVIFAAA